MKETKKAYKGQQIQQEQISTSNHSKYFIQVILSSLAHFFITALSFYLLQPFAYHNQLYSRFHFRYFANFDGFHFNQNSYTHLPNFAFLPGYSSIVSLVQKISGPWAFVVLSICNSLLVYLSALQLQKICRFLKMSQNLAEKCVFLFIYNPAAIYYHSVYSQSIFVFLTFTFISTCLQQITCFRGHTNAKRIIKCVILLMISTLIRSTTLFLLPIIGVHIIVNFGLSLFYKSYLEALNWLKYGVIMLISAISVFLLYLFWSHNRLCTSFQIPNLCYQTNFFNVYSYVQDLYWNVGIFRYYSSSNVVFILIGVPSIALSVIMLRFQRKISQFSLQLSFLILLIITIFMTNLQSGTRFLSTHPAFYINAVMWCHRSVLQAKQKKRTFTVKYLIWKFFRAWQLFYFYIGFILFTLEFPWT